MEPLPVAAIISPPFSAFHSGFAGATGRVTRRWTDETCGHTAPLTGSLGADSDAVVLLQPPPTVVGVSAGSERGFQAVFEILQQSRYSVGQAGARAGTDNPAVHPAGKPPAARTAALRGRGGGGCTQVSTRVCGWQVVANRMNPAVLAAFAALLAVPLPPLSLTPLPPTRHTAGCPARAGAT